MFIYSGAFTWRHSAKEETFILILPNGHVRAGDSVYIFSQWTEDAGIKKKNWFDKLAIDMVKKSANGDDIFTLKGSWYTANVTTQKAYNSLSIIMENHHLVYPLYHKQTFTVNRFWQPNDKHPTDDLCIWTGKINWREFAKNELAMFIFPDGFGEGKPVLSIWQWTKSSSGEVNNLQYREAAQKALPSPGEGLCKFSYHSYYDITGVWDKKTGKLSVNMKENDYSQDLGVMSLTVHVPRHSHHTFNPTELPSDDMRKLPVTLPQAEPALPRILTPLPFPAGILDTLAQSAAFVDQAGYLVKNAEARFNALDAEMHKGLEEIATLKDMKVKLALTVSDLTGNLDSEKARAAKLEKELADAKAAAKHREDELNKKYHDLEDKSSKHDEQDHNTIKAAREELAKATSKIHTLEGNLGKAEVEITSHKKQLLSAQTLVAGLNTKLHDLQVKYDIEYRESEKLHKVIVQLEKEKHSFEQQVKDLQPKLHTATKRLAETQSDLAVALDRAKSEEAKHEETRRSLAAAEAAKNKSAEALVASQAELAVVKGELKTTADSLKASQDKLAGVEGELKTTADALKDSQDKLKTTAEKLGKTERSLTRALEDVDERDNIIDKATKEHKKESNRLHKEKEEVEEASALAATKHRKERDQLERLLLDNGVEPPVFT